MNKDLKKIKNLYGEKMMHLCRELFPTLLEEEGQLSKYMIENFAPSRYLYEDIIENEMVEEFKDFINSCVTKEEEPIIMVNKTPEELLSEAGYILYECHSEEDIQSFRKYYAKGEELCTFKGNRLKKCHVFFAVKKNVSEIKREDFSSPKRQDEYGTSVISIQFTRGNRNTLSIKNRYNHTVNNPDATFGNNLENIIPGLTTSFEEKYNLNINQNKSREFELPNYVKANDGKFYKYNYEIDNNYYCPDNIVIDNFEAQKYDPSSYILVDQYLISLTEKEIYALPDKRFGYDDAFTKTITNIQKIIIEKIPNTNNKKIDLITKNNNTITIEIDELNRIIGYRNNETTKVGCHFLHNNRVLKWIEMSKLKIADFGFLGLNKGLTSISFPELEEVAHGFIEHNTTIENVNLPKLKRADNAFLTKNKRLTKLYLPSLVELGPVALSENNRLIELNIPSIIKLDLRVTLRDNKVLKYINAPMLDPETKAKLSKRFGIKVDNKRENLYYQRIIEIKKSDKSISKSIQSLIKKGSQIGKAILGEKIEPSKPTSHK